MDKDDFTVTVAAAGCRVDGAGVDFAVVFGDTSGSDFGFAFGGPSVFALAFGGPSDFALAFGGPSDADLAFEETSDLALVFGGSSDLCFAFGADSERFSVSSSISDHCVLFFGTVSLGTTSA